MPTPLSDIRVRGLQADVDNDDIDILIASCLCERIIYKKMMMFLFL
jgi:hypothetical protein